MADECIDTVVTSPPYGGLRDYGVAGQTGLEKTPDEYVAVMVEVFREVRRVMRERATLWLNLGDSYAASPRGNAPGDLSTSSLTNPGRQDRVPRGEVDGSSDGAVGRGERAEAMPHRRKFGLKPKDMVGIPWRVAFALQADGWYLRSDIIWSKPNPMPESVTDRPTKAHEYVFLLSKSARYYYDGEAIREEFASSTSDLPKMAEGRDRLGGKNLVAMDPMLAASAATNVGRKRAVGNAIAAMAALDGRDRKPSGWAFGDGRAHEERQGRFPGIGPQHAAARHRGEDYEDGMAINSGRNARSVWTIATQPYPEAHFATFPEELPRRCILAGTPEQVCATCGKPRERVVERTGATGNRPQAIRAREIADAAGLTEAHLSAVRSVGLADVGKARATMSGAGRNSEETQRLADEAKAVLGGYFREWSFGSATTIGLTDCGHDNYRPGVVLDPFAGSGTTLAVARDLGRRSIGVELSPQYVKLIEKRCAQLALDVTG